MVGRNRLRIFIVVQHDNIYKRIILLSIILLIIYDVSSFRCSRRIMLSFHADKLWTRYLYLNTHINVVSTFVNTYVADIVHLMHTERFTSGWVDTHNTIIYIYIYI